MILDQIVDLVTNYKYLILFPLAIVEGPILAVIAGFLCTSGFLNPLLVYPILVLGDITGDTILYVFGRWGIPVFLKRVMKKSDQNNERVNRFQNFISVHPNKFIPLSKISLGIGFAGILIAGNSKIGYQKFIRLCLITSALLYLVYLILGLLFGAAYAEINQYLNVFGTFTIVTILAIITMLFINSIRRKM